MATPKEVWGVWAVTTAVYCDPRLTLFRKEEDASRHVIHWIKGDMENMMLDEWAKARARHMVRRRELDGLMEFHYELTDDTWVTMEWEPIH